MIPFIKNVIRALLNIVYLVIKKHITDIATILSKYTSCFKKNFIGFCLNIYL